MNALTLTIMANSAKKLEKKLDKSQIINAALELLNEVGLDGITTRRLATKVGVKSPSLYWHFSNKQELFAGMREDIILKCLQSIKKCSNLEQWIESIAYEVRSTLLNYRDSILLLTVAPVSHKFQEELIPQLCEPLINAGASKAKAYEVITIVTSFCMGWVIQEQSDKLYDLIAETISIESSFSNGVNVLAKGLSEQITNN